MKKNKIIISVILTMLLVFNTFGSNVFSDQDSSINTIGKNAAFYLTRTSDVVWDDVNVTNQIPLYNFDDKLIAYSVDLQNNKTNEKGYVIVSNIKGDGPIYEFVIGSSSPYSKIIEQSENKPIYNGVLGYYVKNNFKNEGKEVTKYKDLKTSSEITDEQIDLLKKESKNKIYKSKNEKGSNELRDILVSDKNTKNLNISIMSVSSKILSMPDYYWYMGCSPTSAAMVLKYRWPSLPAETALIEELAGDMGTDGDGATSLGMIPYGITSTLQDHGMIISSWNDGAGRLLSTLSEYCLQINNYKPLIVSLVDSTQTAPSYPYGFGNHSMAGVGYYKDAYGNFVIVHDTGVDGDVYCDFDASSFGTNYWTYVD